MNKRVLLVGLLAAICHLSLWAQFRPAWLTNMPAKSGMRRAVGCAKTPDEARLDAAAQLVAELNFIAEEGSLRQLLVSREEVPDQRPALARVATHSSWVKTIETFADDTASWAFCEMKASQSNVKALLDSIYRSALDEGTNLLLEGRDKRQGGDLQAAAICFARGLDVVTPVLNRKMLTDRLFGEDVATALYADLISVFDGVTLEGTRRQFPMVQGEAIPETFTFKVTKNGAPVANLPVRTTIEGDGRIKSDVLTASNGTFTARVEQAPKADTACLKAGLNVAELSRLPQTIASPIVTKKIADLGSQQWRLTLKSFNPATICLVSMAEQDVDVAAEPLKQLLTSHDYVITDQTDQADLYLTLTFDGKAGQPFKAGDNMLVEYVADMTIRLSVKKDDTELMKYDVNDYKLLQPALKAPEKMRTRAVGQMVKRALDDMPLLLEAVDYDKRGAVYESAK